MFSRRRAYNRFRAVEATVSTSTALSKQASTESHTYDSCRSFNKSQRNIERRVSCAHCDHLQSTRTGQSVYAKSDNDGGWPSSRVISSRFFFSPSIESRSVRQSVTLVVWNWFDNLWPDSKAFHCVYLSSEHGTSTLESIEHPKNFRRKFFFFSFFQRSCLFRVFAISICNFASNATRNEQLPWWPCLDVMSSAVGKLCKCGTNWISCRDLLGRSYLTSYIASSATRIHIRFYASSARFDSVSFSSFLLPPPPSLLVWFRATRDRCTNTRDGLSVISKLVNDVIETNRNPKNCVFVCPTLPRLITTIFTTESMHRIWENFSLTKVNIASCCTICA